MAAFITPGNLADKLKQFNIQSRGGMLTLPERLVKSIKVKTTHLGYKKSVYRVMTTSARETRFRKDTGEEITVEKYFEQSTCSCILSLLPFLKKSLAYKKKLKHAADLPVINLGTRQKPNYVPAELCEILPGCIFRDRLSSFETSKMMNVACKPPHENAQAITEIGFPFLGFSQQNSPLEPFGISIDPEMAVIPARELAPPRISGSKPITNINKASWYFANNVKFVRGARIDSWGVLAIQDGANGIGLKEANAIVDGFVTKLRKCGVSVPEKAPGMKPIRLVDPVEDDASRSKSVRMIREGLTGAGDVSFILVLLNNVDKVIYPAVKVGRWVLSFWFYELTVVFRKLGMWNWGFIRFACRLARHWIRGKRISGTWL
jgi:hypothetical protein